MESESDQYYLLGICFRYGSIQNLNHIFVATNHHGCKMFHGEIPIGSVVSDITNDVPFLCHVTSNIYLFCNFFFKASMQ